ncbi:MAG: bifunctional phosphoribosyl-AMP cyclohydrolase/phosphoribosyl-ATP diphosphatase HisIE, partial [Dehalococcoidia bacterium]
GGTAMNVKLDQQGLVPAVVKDINTKEVLMLGYASPESLKRTLEEGQVWFYSRSREELWHKGETSGNYMNVKAAWVDCDGDTLLLQVEPEGPTCHTGNVSCFFTSLDGEPEYERVERGSGVLDELFAVIQQRKQDLPEGSYTADLFRAGTGRVAQKVVEEAGETAIAAVQGDTDQTAREVADLFYHALVLLAASDVNPEAVWQELRDRRKG